MFLLHRPSKQFPIVFQFGRTGDLDFSVWNGFGDDDPSETDQPHSALFIRSVGGNINARSVRSSRVGRRIFSYKGTFFGAQMVLLFTEEGRSKHISGSMILHMKSDGRTLSGVSTYFHHSSGKIITTSRSYIQATPYAYHILRLNFGRQLEWHMENGTRPICRSGSSREPWTFAELSSAINVSERSVKGWASGQVMPSPDALNRLFDVMFSRSPYYDEYISSMRRAINDKGKIKITSRHSTASSINDLGEKGLGQLIMDSAELKFTIMGFGINLKPLVERLSRKSR